jgi:hypothetical protein
MVETNEGRKGRMKIGCIIFLAIILTLASLVIHAWLYGTEADMHSVTNIACFVGGYLLGTLSIAARL